MKTNARVLAGGLALLLLGCADVTSLDNPGGLERREIDDPIHPTMAIGLGTHGHDTEACDLYDMNATLTRVTYSTIDDANNPNYRLLFGLRLTSLRDRGLAPLVLVDDFFPDTVNAPTIMASLVTSFPGTTWQILNERDADATFLGDDYARMMQNVVPAMRTVESNVKIVGMGISSTDGQSWAVLPDSTRAVNFTQSYLANSGPILNAWAIHPYSVSVPLATVITDRVRQVRAAMSDAMPIWITETGEDDANLRGVYGSGITNAQIDSLQALNDSVAVGAAQTAGVTALYFYQLWTAPGDYGFGVLRADHATRRPSYYALKSIMHFYLPLIFPRPGSGTCP